MPSLLRYSFAGIILGLLVGVPCAYFSWRQTHYRNFHVVREGILYRSGQLPLVSLRRVIHDHGIKTVVTLRYAEDPKGTPPDNVEEYFCKTEKMRHFRLRHRTWGSEDNSVPAEVNVKTFHEIMSDPQNYPVLVHCFAGIHRTGTFCALYRMEFDNWSNAQAMQEMKEMGYTIHHPDVFQYLENYQRRGYSLGTGSSTATPVGTPAASR